MQVDFLDDKFFFSARIYELLGRKDVENFVFSPLFVQYFNVLMRLGAHGSTAEELKTVLRHMDLDDETIKVRVRNSIKTITGQGNSQNMSFTSSMFVNDRFKVNDQFREMAKEFFGVDIYSLDFNEPNAESLINAQMADETMMAETRNAMTITENTELVLTNTVSFKIRWMIPFPTEQIFINFFYVKEDRPVATQFLHAISWYNRYESATLGVDMVELPLENERSMVIVRPRRINGLAEVEKKIDEIFSVPLTEFKVNLVRVEIPKFKILTRINYGNMLDQIGVFSIFDICEADLRGIIENSHTVAVDFFYQKVLLLVEDGGISSGELFDIRGQEYGKFFSRNTFTVDRPFLFYVKHWGHILFGGRITNPEYFYRIETGESSSSDGSITSFGHGSKKEDLI